MSRPATSQKQHIRARLADEVGTIRRVAPRRLCLCYPSPYHVAMSSLGYQTIYRLVNQLPGWAAARAFLPDDDQPLGGEPLLSYEDEQPIGDYPILAFSVAYELELTGLFDCLRHAGLPVHSRARGAHQPLVLAGGPLTFSNPLPLGPFVDAVLLGECEQLLPTVLATIEAHDAGAHADRAALLEALAKLPHVWVPALHGEELPSVARADDDQLPAYSQIRTPHTELSNMFLVEPERGCSRGCTYCVMRRSTNGGMRKLDPDLVLSKIPDDAKRVGLVGAAVTDHPRIRDIVRRIVDSDREVGISSLRADRLDDELVGLLARGGYRTLTTASDGASERLRALIERRTKEKHLLQAALLAKRHGMIRIKLYEMVGLPTETDDDIDELARFATEISKVLPIALGIAPFVAKRNTPLDGAPFEDAKVLEARLDRLRRAVKGRVEIRATSVRWAWVEYVLAQGGMAAGERALQAHQEGGSFAAWKRAFSDAGDERRRLRVVS